MSLLHTFDISGSAMAAQSVRLNTIASNLANAQSVAQNREDTYRARHPVFSEALRNQFGTRPSVSTEAGGNVGSKVLVTGIVESTQPLNLRYEPAHPFADKGRYGAYAKTLEPSSDLTIRDALGSDLVFGISGAVGDTLEVLGSQGAFTTIDTSGANVVSVGGAVEFTLQENVTFANATPAVNNLFGALNSSAYTAFALNTFDPGNQDTYNAATPLTVFDSLGPHAMSVYFVKERFTPGVPGEEANRWSAYAQIDGRDVGDPDPNLPPPQNAEPTLAQFDVRFNQDGTLDAGSTGAILISNWIPLDANGNPNGAQGPQNVLAGGGLPVANPPNSSNFEVRLGDSTQFGSEFAVNRLDQDGYTTGELSGLAIDSAGVISARFTNGQNQTLGQVAVADFANARGLAAIGNTSWIETNESGTPVVAAPGSGSLEAIQSGALEDSNVELSERLVQLIIAQRNFQANARTISTADEIQQTIINL